VTVGAEGQRPLALILSPDGGVVVDGECQAGGSLRTSKRSRSEPYLQGGCSYTRTYSVRRFNIVEYFFSYFFSMTPLPGGSESDPCR
jgi:hypothetical protein